jgi:hypothetical protein
VRAVIYQEYLEVLEDVGKIFEAKYGIPDLHVEMRVPNCIKFIFLKLYHK